MPRRPPRSVTDGHPAWWSLSLSSLMAASGKARCTTAPPCTRLRAVTVPPRVRATFTTRNRPRPTGFTLAALIRFAQVRQHRRLETGARIGNDQVQGIRLARGFEAQPVG